MIRTTKFTLFGLFLAAGLFMGCKDSDNPAEPTQPGLANVMVIHASPDAPGVDVLVDGAVALTNVTFPQNSSYLAVNAGTRNVVVNVTGGGPTVIAAPLPVLAGMNYSVFAIDSVANLTPFVLLDTLTTPAAGKAHVRFIHLSPNAPAVDVAVTGGPVLFADYAFAENSSFTPVDAGTYNLEVRLAGTSNVVLPLPGITLTAGKIYTVWASGFVGGAGAQALSAQIITNN
jgi:hypothetical protein